MSRAGGLGRGPEGGEDAGAEHRAEADDDRVGGAEAPREAAYRLSPGFQRISSRPAFAARARMKSRSDRRFR